jgi:hypothetical protein
MASKIANIKVCSPHNSLVISKKTTMKTIAPIQTIVIYKK